MQTLNLGGWLAIPLAFVMHWWIGRGAAWEPMVDAILALAFFYVPAAPDGAVP